MKRRFALVVFLMSSLLLAGVEAAELEVRVFTLKHKTPAEASQEVQPLLSAEGSLTVKPGANSLTVQDHPDVVDQVAVFLKRYDVGPPEFVIRLSLLLATNTKPNEGDTTELAEDLLWRLRRMFRYQYFIPQGSTVVHGKSGDEVAVKLAEAYSVTFKPLLRRFIPVPSRKGAVSRGQRSQGGLRTSQSAKRSPESPVQPDVKPRTKVLPRTRLIPTPRIRLNQLRLLKEEPSKNGTLHRQEVLRTSVILSSGQRVVLGATSSEAARSALVLVVEALPEEER